MSFLPEGHAILEDTPGGQLREGVTYVTRSVAKARGWLPDLPERDADAARRGLYGFLSDGREYRYSAAHNGLVQTGRIGTEAERAEAARLYAEGPDDN